MISNEDKVYTHCFYRNKNFTDNGLISFGTSLEKLSALNLISLDFFKYKINIIF